MRYPITAVAFLAGTLVFAQAEGLLKGLWDPDEILYQAGGWVVYVAPSMAISVLLSILLIWAISKARLNEIVFATPWRRRALVATILFFSGAAFLGIFLEVFPVSLALSSLLASILGCRARVAA